MNILIKQARVVDPQSTHNGKIADIFIEHGAISRIGKNLEGKADKVIAAPDLCVSPGWVDMFADFADPGYEHRETLATGAAAAAAGGFTDVCVIPNTKPTADQKAIVDYIRQQAAALPVSIHPLGAISKHTEGKELAEMYDLHRAGAVAFTDGTQPVQAADLMLKALQYVKPVDGVVIQLPDMEGIAPAGIANEGIAATRLGLPGKPSLAEELMVIRDIKLAAYTGSRLHLTGISTAAAVQQVKEAKKQQAPVTVSVTPYHLFFTDEALAAYDTNLKVNPPLRTEKDKKALQKAVQDRLIDCIASHHSPHDADEKVVEFQYAKYGMAGLQTVYAAINTAMPHIPQEQWVQMLAINSRHILRLPVPAIAPGARAVLTLFQPGVQWQLQQADILSRSKNSAFTGRILTGRPLGIINGQYTNL